MGSQKPVAVADVDAGLPRPAPPGDRDLAPRADGKTMLGHIQYSATTGRIDSAEVFDERGALPSAQPSHVPGLRDPDVVQNSLRRSRPNAWQRQKKLTDPHSRQGLIVLSGLEEFGEPHRPVLKGSPRPGSPRPGFDRLPGRPPPLLGRQLRDRRTHHRHSLTASMVCTRHPFNQASTSLIR